MTSVITGAAQAAHAAVAHLLASAQIKPGEELPHVMVKEDDATKSAPLTLTGSSVIVGVPGAFTGTCNAQVPGYIQNLDKFKEKGISNIYIVAVNDVFVMKAWKENLAPSGTGVHFISDDKGEFVSKCGLIYDATAHLGAPRSKRFVIIADGSTVRAVAVEEDPSKITITSAERILAQL